jgi:glycosyltransferase involved in cell wall biosynthesis
MYHSDLLGGFVGMIFGIPVIWNIRRTSLSLATISPLTLLIARLCSLLSYVIPRRIVCCSHSAAHSHRQLGFNASIIEVIPNGFDSKQFLFNAQATSALRHSWFGTDGLPIVGMVSRFNAAKDHSTLLKAVSNVLSLGYDFRLILVGTGIDLANRKLMDSIEDLGIAEFVHLSGPSSNIPLVMSALDLHILSSFSEGFPNVVAEALLAGTPCISSDVGDAREIIGDTGWLVPPACVYSLSEAISEALSMCYDKAGWETLKVLGRRRVCERFGISQMTTSYNQVWSAASSSNMS